MFAQCNFAQFFLPDVLSVDSFTLTEGITCVTNVIFFAIRVTQYIKFCILQLILHLLWMRTRSWILCENEFLNIWSRCMFHIYLHIFLQRILWILLSWDFFEVLFGWHLLFCKGLLWIRFFILRLCRSIGSFDFIV